MKNFKFTFFVIWSFLILGSAGQCFSGQLHLIFVGDTTASELETGIFKDLETVENHVKEISDYTALNLQSTVFLGPEATSSSILNHLKDLKSKNDDVIFFYFSGHGYRTPSKENNPWPNLYFQTNATGIDLQEIANILDEKEAHLKIAFADCCNSPLPNHLAPPVAKGHYRPQGSREKAKRNYSKLFVESNGLVLIASSEAGQSSWSTSKFGSLYTKAYSDAFLLMKYLDANIVDWSFVLDTAAYKVHETTEAYGISQTPIYQTP